MFIAHFPAGYILTKKLQKVLKTNSYLFIGLIASVLPDIDILYFYLIDNRQTPHHSYWIHIFFYWLVISIVVLLTVWLFKKIEYRTAAIIFFSNIFLHLALDTIVGGVKWLFPLSEKCYYLFEVPAIHDFWVYNFISHWTFLLEIGVIVWAITTLFKKQSECRS